ncbi:UNVERIFIED_CONTAM: hypothetical protein Sindi_0050200 [Sesamum indicum]
MDNSMNCDILTSSEQFLHLALGFMLNTRELKEGNSGMTLEILTPAMALGYWGEISTLSLKLAKGKEEWPLKSGLWRTLATCCLTVAFKMLDLKGHSSLDREIDFSKDLTDSFTPIHGSTHSPSPASNTSPEMSLTTVPYYSRNCVTTSWQHPIHGQGMFKFQQKLYRLKAALKTWNFEVFGNIFQNICTAGQKAKEAEKRFDDDPTDENLIDMNKATAELTFALSVEECYWKQKAACRWLTEGEKNTKYFHTLVKKKRKQSHIHAIQHNGTTLTKPEEIKDSVVEYFKRVFTEEEEVSDDPLLWVPQLLSEEDTQHLGCAPTLEEIKAMVFSMCPDSTAGPDGFTSTFIRVVGTSLQKT